MIIVTKPGISEEDLDRLRERIEATGLRTHISRGEQRTLLGCIGDEALLEQVPLRSFPGVEQVLPILKPYKLASLEFAAEATRVRTGNAVIGGPELAVIAGPCSIDDEGSLRDTAHSIKKAGAKLLRGGAFKPRTSPYSFQGLGRDGLEILLAVRTESGLPVVTEVMDTRHVELVAQHADMLQVGARNMQNFALLSEVGRLHRPVLLKRGMSATIKDLLLAAEYIMNQGNMNVVLCERGIRTFETATRNTFDVSAIPVLKSETHLPVIADPSHAVGRRDLVEALSLAAVAAGADGLMIEVHPDPALARCDGDQALTLAEFDSAMTRIDAVARAVGRTSANTSVAAA